MANLATLGHDWWADHEANRVRRMQDLAARGKWLADREDDELEDMRIGAAVTAVLTETVPGRAADRAAAGAMLYHLRANGFAVYLEHGAARVSPVPPDLALALRIDRLQPALCDLLDEESRRA